MRKSTTRWVIQRRDGKFVCQGGVWGEDLGNADMWVDRYIAAQAARRVDDRARVREVRVTTTLELVDDAAEASPERVLGPSEAVGDFVRTLEAAHKASEGSQLRFK